MLTITSTRDTGRWDRCVCLYNHESNINTTRAQDGRTLFQCVVYGYLTNSCVIISFPGQKCLRKRHLCYTVIGRDIRSSSVISELGVFSKSAPDGFTCAGELNGLVIAYKTIKINVDSNGSAKTGKQVHCDRRLYAPVLKAFVNIFTT